VRLERESRERMVDSNGRVIELEDDSMLPPPVAEAGAAPAMAGPGRVDARPLRGIGAQNGPAASGEMHERHR
jgi:hypothetical protein